MKKNVAKFLAFMVVCVLGMFALTMSPSAAEGPENNGVVTGPAVETPMPTATPTINAADLKMNKSSEIIMAKKKTTLAVAGTEYTPVWISSNEKVATVNEKGVVKGVAKGTATITAQVFGASVSATIKVVPKMSKKDFSKFNKQNFIKFCKKKGYNYGYAWSGQWKGYSKKKKTYRGIKIGMSQAAVKKVYGDFTAKKCKKSDPFTKMKGLKRSKVKTYTDMVYGKYRIRFYFNKKKQVASIIFCCNVKRIKKSAVKKYI